MKTKLITAFFAALLTTLTACPGVQALPGTPVPSELQGEWTYGTIWSVQYYNPNNGQWGQVNGAGDRFKLEPNGDYERSRLIQISTYGCESNLFIPYKLMVLDNFEILRKINANAYVNISST